jgi:hypothetical protein
MLELGSKAQPLCRYPAPGRTGFGEKPELGSWIASGTPCIAALASSNSCCFCSADISRHSARTASHTFAGNANSLTEKAGWERPTFGGQS